MHGIPPGLGHFNPFHSVKLQINIFDNQLRGKLEPWWIYLEVRIFTGTSLGNIGKRDTCNAAFRHVKVRRRGYY
jgi:hypothetical protein